MKKLGKVVKVLKSKICEMYAFSFFRMKEIGKFVKVLKRKIFEMYS